MAQELTKGFCEQIEFTGKLQDYMDTTVPGMGFRVLKTRKAFIFRAKLEGKAITITLGRFPNLTLARARKQARIERGKFDQGINTLKAKKDQQAKAERKRELTLASTWDQYDKTKKLAANTKKEYARFLTTYFKEWADKPLNEITRPMVVTKFKACHRKSPSRANHAFRFLRAIFNFSQGMHLDDEFMPMVRDNPVQILSSMKLWGKVDSRTGHVQSKEFKSYWEALEAFTGSRAKDFVFYVKLLILTGLRRDEGLRLKWKDIDLEECVLTAVDTKNGRKHTLPIGEYLTSLFKERSQTGEWVFPGRKKEKPASEYRPQFKELSDNWEKKISAHDCRRTFATFADEVGLTDRINRRLMNHKTMSLTDEYVQLTVDKLREPMQRIENYVLAQVQETEVLPFVRVRRK